jgi:hypothetical protein
MINTQGDFRFVLKMLGSPQVSFQKQFSDVGDVHCPIFHVYGKGGVRKNNLNMILDVVESYRGLYSGWVFMDLLSTWLFDSKMKLIKLATYL